MTGSPTVRFALQGDADTVARLLVDFNREFATPTPRVGVLASRLDRLFAADTALVVLLIGDPPAGVAVVSFRPSVWYEGPIGTLDELYIQPDRRRQGLGSVLLEAVEDLVCQRGGEELQINVDGADTDARRFYERHGYRNTDTGRDDQMLLYLREWPAAPDAAPPEPGHTPTGPAPPDTPDKPAAHPTSPTRPLPDQSLP